MMSFVVGNRFHLHCSVFMYFAAFNQFNFEISLKLCFKSPQNNHISTLTISFVPLNILLNAVKDYDVGLLNILRG